MMPTYELGRSLYKNSLATEKDLRGFRLEGKAKFSFPDGRLRMENAADPSEGQKSNFVYWCPKDFPSDIAISWEFRPIREPGLCIMFFAAKAKNGEDILDPKLAKRTGEYEQYHHGDINAFHVSYFRRKFPEERAFHTCNLRKSYGFNLVCQGADPIPSVEDAQPPYRIQVVKFGSGVWFYINDLLIFNWEDDGKTYGPLLDGGKIGFRQMAPLIAEYGSLEVHEVRNKESNLKSKTPVTQISAGWNPAVHAYFDLCPESPDGKRVTYFQFMEGPPGQGQVMVADLESEGGRLRPVRHQPIGEPCRGGGHEGVEQQWVDKDTVAYVAGRGETVVCSLKDGSMRRLQGSIRMFCPANGMGLSTRGPVQSDEPTVYQMDFRTGAFKKLFGFQEMLAIHPWKDSIKDLDKVFIKHTKWTDDGKHFFVVFTNEGYPRPADVRLVKSILVADADGSNLRYLAEFGHHPMWSADGTYAYAFDFRPNNLLDLTAYPIDGSKPYALLTNIQGWHASVRPDGTSCVTDVGGLPEEKGMGGLLLYDLKTKARNVLVAMKMPDTTHATGVHAHPVWSKDGKRVYFNSADTGVPHVYSIEIP